MAINGRDQTKLLRAGFRLLRVRGKKVVYATGQKKASWATLKEFKTPAACKREFTEYMKDEKNLEG